jgi:two-component system response regulator YesN
MEEQSGSLAFELSAVMKQHLNRTVSIGLSDVKASMNRVADAWTEANERLAVAFYSGSGSVIIPPVSRPAEPEQPIRLESYFDSLYAAIQHSDRNEADRLLAEIERCARRHRIAPTALFELYAWLVAKLNRASDGQLGSVIRDDIDFRQFIAGLQAVCEATWSGGQMIIREREEIRKSLEYIESHYSKAIYLEDIARHVNLNPAYLSTLFNRELKMGLSEYINRKRIKLAAELLNKRFYSNIELADAVGIHNERYFCTLFKKYTGTTPQKYRCNLKPY